jgi:PTH1 family peptidyl-tRNA hydrolase
MKKLLIVWLGNPWVQYEQTRHNAWFLIVDQRVELQEISREYKQKYQAEICSINQHHTTIYCLKPMTYMNRSGLSVAAFASYHEIASTNILVIHDEIDFPVGKIQCKQGGSAAGHNGIKDIYARIGTQDIARLRVWVDRPSSGSVADYVLSPFDTAQSTAFQEKIIPACMDIVDEWVKNINF